MRALLLYIAIGLATFSGASAWIRSHLPPPEGVGLRAKLEYFREHKDEFDVLFIGSSRIVRGVDNALVDEELAARGIEVRSFNLAVGGMRTFEQDHMQHQVLEMEPARLRWIFFEGGPVGMGVRKDHIFRSPPNLNTDRGVAWHTGRETRNVLRSLARLPLSTREKIRQAILHVELMSSRYTNYGKGEKLIRELRESSEARLERERKRDEILAGQGYQGLEEVTGREVSEEVLAFLDEPGPFEERMGSIEAENELPVEMEHLYTEMYEEQLRATEERGIRLVYLLPPGYEGTPERLMLYERGVIPELLNFNDPARYPNLFRLDHRFDKGHMNRRGAVLLSGYIAEAIAELLGQGPSPL